MKKLIVGIACFVLIFSAAACGSDIQTNEEISDVQTEDVVTQAREESYTITVPDDFEVQQNDSDYNYFKTWYAASHDEDNYELTAYDIGHSDYTNDTLPTDFEEWIEKDGFNQENSKCEKVLFDYIDGEEYEEYTVVAKVVYTEGSNVYDAAKLNAGLASLDAESDSNPKPETTEFPAELVCCTGKKVIVDKADRTKVVAAVISSDDAGDVVDFEQILESFDRK